MVLVLILGLEVELTPMASYGLVSRKQFPYTEFESEQDSILTCQTCVGRSLCMVKDETLLK